MAYTKEQLITILQEAVGGTPYGDALIAKVDAFEPGFYDGISNYDYKDLLDQTFGVLKAYERVNRFFSEEAKATPEAEKIPIIEKALEAIKNFGNHYTRDEFLDTVKKAVSGTLYGDALIVRLENMWDFPPDVIFTFNPEDSLEEILGVLRAYVRIHENFSEEAMATPIDEKLDIVEKALEVEEELEKSGEEQFPKTKEQFVEAVKKAVDETLIKTPFDDLERTDVDVGRFPEEIAKTSEALTEKIDIIEKVFKVADELELSKTENDQTPKSKNNKNEQE